MPTNCPACNSLLELVKDQLFCRNPDCVAQQQKKVEHFCKTLKIKGMGPSSIQKLSITDINEIYELDVEEVEYLLNSSKLAEKLIAEIERSKKASLNSLLPAFGVPLIGKTASEKLCNVITSIEGISEHYCREAGLGPKATANLLTWYETEFKPNLSSLPFSFKTEHKTQGTKGVVCISGRLSSYKSKAEAQNILEENGYTVKSSVTKDVTILINESGIESTKTKKAKESGIQIVSNINELIGY